MSRVLPALSSLEDPSLYGMAAALSAADLFIDPDPDPVANLSRAVVSAVRAAAADLAVVLLDAGVPAPVFRAAGVSFQFEEFVSAVAAAALAARDELL